MFTEPPGQAQPHHNLTTTIPSFTREVCDGCGWCFYQAPRLLGEFWLLVWDADQGAIPDWRDIVFEGVRRRGSFYINNISLSLSIFRGCPVFWFGGFGAFASVCQTYVAMPSGWHSITQDWKGAIKGAVRVLKDPFQHMTFLHPSWSRYHCTQSNSVHVSLYEFPTILPGYPVPYLHPRAHPCVPSKNVGNKLTNFVSSCIFPLILPRQFVSSSPLHH